MVGHSGYKFKGNERDAAIYYATFGPSMTVEQWLQQWLSTTYRKRTLVEVKKKKSGSHQMRLFVQTQAHGVESENAPRVLHLAGKNIITGTNESTGCFH